MIAKEEAVYFSPETVVPTSGFMALFYEPSAGFGPQEEHLALYDLAAIGIATLVRLPPGGKAIRTEEKHVVGYMLRAAEFAVADDLAGFLGVFKVGTFGADIRASDLLHFSLEDHSNAAAKTKFLTEEQKKTLPIYHYALPYMAYSKYTHGQQSIGGKV